MGFLIASAPLGCALMGWRGAGGGGAATIGVFYFFGGMLQIIGSVMEWIIGNTFPFVVFGSYGAFWLALGATLQPSFNASGAYVDGKTGAAAAAGEAEFLSSFGMLFSVEFAPQTEIWIVDEYSLLHSLHRSVDVFVPHLCDSHQYCVCHNFLLLGHRIIPSRRSILDSCQREHRAGTKCRKGKLKDIFSVKHERS
jgi:hypothetical protein